MAEIKQAKQVEASPRIQRKPSREALPTIDWLRVAELLVDYSYQHRPYASAIDALNKDFQDAYSGFILVNQREEGSLWILDGQTRYAVHQLRDIQWIRAEMLYGLTQAQEAEVYLLKCINAKRMPVDFFLAEFVAKRPVAVLIHEVLTKRGIEIESYASTQRHRGMDTVPVVTCVSYLRRMIAREKKDEKGNPTGEVLGMALDLIHDTWEYSGNSLTAIFLDSIHKLLVAHDEEIDRKAFIAKLEGHRPEELREQALLLRLGTKPLLSTGTALQRVMIDLYNSGRPQHRRITLDLQTAAKRYEEIRRFWAREIAQLLIQRGARTQISALQKLAAENKPVKGNGLFIDPLDTRYANVHSRATSASQLWKSLRQGGLVTRQRQSLGEYSRPFFYMLTELGALVLEYIPDDYEFGEKKKISETNIEEGEKSPQETPRKKRGRPRKTPALA